jgi:hypothetical protein
LLDEGSLLGFEAVRERELLCCLVVGRRLKEWRLRLEPWRRLKWEQRRRSLKGLLRSVKRQGLPLERQRSRRWERDVRGLGCGRGGQRGRALFASGAAERRDWFASAAEHTGIVQPHFRWRRPTCTRAPVRVVHLELAQL